VNRIEAIQARLGDYLLDGILLSSPASCRYACGFAGDGILLITKKRAFCFVSPLDRMQAELSADGVTVLTEAESYPQAFHRMAEELKLGLIGFEETAFSIAQFWVYQGGIQAKMIPAADLLLQLRKIKTAEEQEMLRQAQQLTENTYQRILSIIRPGVTESRLRGAIAGELLSAGAEEIAFPPVVAFGTRTAFPHGISGDAVLREGELILLDMGCVLNGYCSDLSRTICCGAADPEQKRRYRAVAAAKERAALVMKPNGTVDWVQKAAQDTLEQVGLRERMLHSICHGIGLEKHESPCMAENLLSVGNVIALEPGIYFPGEYGIRLEDVYQITDSGVLAFSQATVELPEVCT